MYKIRQISDLKPSSYSYIVRKSRGVGIFNYKGQLKYTLETTYWGERYLDCPYQDFRNLHITVSRTGNYISRKYPHGYVMYSEDEKFESRRYL